MGTKINDENDMIAVPGYDTLTPSIAEALGTHPERATDS
jgi:hypothetical protein